MQCRCLYIDIFNNDDTRERENDQYWALAAPVSWDVPITARFLNAVKFFSGGRISGCFVKKSGLTVLNNFYFKGKTKSTSAVRRKYLFCSSSFFNLMWKL